MALIKLVGDRDRERIEGKQPGSSQVNSGLLDDMQSMLVTESAPAIIASDIDRSSGSVEVPSMEAPTVDEPVEPLMPAGNGGFLKRVREDEETHKNGHRAALDYLNILKSLAPVFKAAMIYPGHDAAPEQIGAAVRKMSQVSVNLADFIAMNSDKLELDTAWARKTLHDFTAELVSSHWISTVIGKGGVVPGYSPDISVEYFVPAIRAVIELPAELPRAPESTDLSLAGAVQLSLLKALTPIVIEVEKFTTILNSRVPTAKSSSEALIAEIGQFAMEQALFHHEKFLNDNQDVTSDDRRMMLQALIEHTSGVMLSAWEYCRGEVLGAIKDAATPEQAAAILTQSQFTHGFPLSMLKNRAEASLRRLTGTSQYAMTMMRQAAVERANQRGATHEQ